MKKRCWSIGLTILSILMLTLSTVQMRGNVFAASPPPKTLAGTIPSAVTSGQARLVRHHVVTDQLSLAIGLPLRNQRALTQLLQEVSTPGNTQYRHYLTQAQANQAFNPTPQQEQQVIGWLQSHGLMVTHTYPNHLLIDVTGTFAQIEQVFHVTINDYRVQQDGEQITFYAPVNEPTVDGSVGSIVDTILGLDDYPSFQVNDSLALTRSPDNGNAHGSPPYYPQDFANAYDVNPLWKAGYNGARQHIGIIMWAPPPSSAALQLFDAKTGAQPPNIQQKLVDGGSNNLAVAGEAALDVESASGMAPGATIDYYEAPRTTNGLDDALNMAGTDTNNFANAQISNSWYGSDGRYWSSCEAANLTDPFTMKTEQILQSNTVTGHDYLFASGDKGSACIPNPNQPCTYKDPYPQYPASSAYVTSVGGTNLSIQNNSWQTEVAWDYTVSSCTLGGLFGTPPAGSGGGYSKLFAQPSWQVGFSKNTHRGYPDVAADADNYTGAFVCFDGIKGPVCEKVGGTSLATPLWAGMMADVNQYVQSQNEPPLGFINPLLYAMHTGMPYTAYHDIQQGTNGKYTAHKGWDAVTGLGSPDLYNLARDAASLGTSTSYNGQLNAIAAVSASDVWAVGYSYTNGNAINHTLIEHWNGSTWTVVPSPNPSQYGNVLFSVAAVATNDVWAVGDYEDSNRNYHSLAEYWNGNTWVVVPSPKPSSCPSLVSIGGCDYLSSVAAVSANDVWAVGDYYDATTMDNDTLIEHWNGSTWSVVPSPNPTPCSTESFCGELSGVATVATNDVWAVGYYADSSSFVRTLIEHWNGSAWSVVVASPWGSIDLKGVAAVSTSDVWAVGSDGATAQTEHWNGGSWGVVPSPNPTSCGFCSELSGVATVATNNVWAVGYYADSSSFVRTRIERWNGSTWTAVPSPNPSPYGNGLSSVAEVAANDVWAVGDYADSKGNTYTLAEYWNGSTWTVVPSP